MSLWSVSAWGTQKCVCMCVCLCIHPYDLPLFQPQVLGMLLQTLLGSPLQLSNVSMQKNKIKFEWIIVSSKKNNC